MIKRLVHLLRKVTALPGAEIGCPSGAASGAVAALSCAMESVRREELARRMEREALSPEEVERMERFSRALVERLLQEPERRLTRLAAAGADPEELADALRLLGPAGEKVHRCPMRQLLASRVTQPA